MTLMSAGSSVEAQPLNDVIVYTEAFAQEFQLDTDKAIELPGGLMAARVYWTTAVTGQKLDPRPKVQLFIEESVPLNLADDEGVWVNTYAAKKSGFLGFANKINQEDLVFEQEQYDEFFNRIVVITADGFTTETLDQYTNKLVPGIQAIEFGSLIQMFNPPFDIYLYIGKEANSGSVNHLINKPDEYKKHGFIKLTLPQAINEALKQPYIEPQPSDSSIH